MVKDRIWWRNNAGSEVSNDANFMHLIWNSAKQNHPTLWNNNNNNFSKNIVLQKHNNKWAMYHVDTKYMYMYTLVLLDFVLINMWFNCYLTADFVYSFNSIKIKIILFELYEMAFEFFSYPSIKLSYVQNSCCNHSNNW